MYLDEEICSFDNCTGMNLFLSNDCLMNNLPLCLLNTHSFNKLILCT